MGDGPAVVAARCPPNYEALRPVREVVVLGATTTELVDPACCQTGPAGTREYYVPPPAVERRTADPHSSGLQSTTDGHGARHVYRPADVGPGSLGRLPAATVPALLRARRR